MGRRTRPRSRRLFGFALLIAGCTPATDSSPTVPAADLPETTRATDEPPGQVLQERRIETH